MLPTSSFTTSASSRLRKRTRNIAFPTTSFVKASMLSVAAVCSILYFGNRMEHSLTFYSGRLLDVEQPQADPKRQHVRKRPSQDDIHTVITSAVADETRHSLFSSTSQYHDVCVVGAGLSGAVIAERYATLLQQQVLVLEKRDHIGGNCHDYMDEEANVRVSKYGAHLFHTRHERVWNYVQQFSEWTHFEHRVLGVVNGTHVPIPVNIQTVNTLLGLTISNSSEMDDWLRNEQVRYDHEPANAEEVALSRVGPRLYEWIFRPYTRKQWDKEPSELGPEVTARIPVRNNFDGRYFSDPYQALPKRGYTAMFENMLDQPNIQVMTGVDYFDVRDQVQCGKTYYTGPIDTYFRDLGWDALQYRSLTFERQVHKNIQGGVYQPAFVVNHPAEDVDFTRIVEYKHLPDQPESNHTVIFVERSSAEGEPYYPVPNQRNKDLFKKYQEMADQEEGVTFVGRLANYKYFNMDDAILNALELFDKDTNADAATVSKS